MNTTAGRPTTNPKYRLHRRSGQAVVTLPDVHTGKRKDVYLGIHGTDKSMVRYDEVVRQWRANGCRHESPTYDDRLTVAGLCEKYLEHARGYYAAGEFRAIRAVLKRLAAMYGSEPAKSIGPMRLRTFRESMVSDGMVRTSINAMIARIVRMYRWAASNEMVSPEIQVSLGMLEPLREGKTEALESAPVLAVPDDLVQATLPHLPEIVADMVRVQLLTGARPGELIAMRPKDIDRSGDIWLYTVATHKTSWRGKERTIPIGPRAQEVLARYLVRPEGSFVFSPKESAERAYRRRIESGQVQRVGKPNFRARNRYTTVSYGRAVSRACERGGLEHWHPHQLRHTASDVMSDAGVGGETGASKALGHSSEVITRKVYRSRDLKEAIEVARRVG